MPSDRMLIWLIEKGRNVIGNAAQRRREIAALAENLEEMRDVCETPERFRLWTCERTHDLLTDAPPPPCFDGYKR